MDPRTKEEWYFQQSPDGQQTWAGKQQDSDVWEIRPYPPQAAVAAQKWGTPLFTFKEKWRHPPVYGPLPIDVATQLTSLWTEAMQALDEACESWWQTVDRDMRDIIEEARITTGYGSVAAGGYVDRYWVEIPDTRPHKDEGRDGGELPWQ